MDKKFLDQLSKSGGKITMQGGGGNLTGVLAENKTVLKDARHLNFTGSGVTVTKSARGKVDINIPISGESISASDVDGVGLTYSNGTISINRFHLRSDPSIINSGLTGLTAASTVGLKVNAGNGLLVSGDIVKVVLDSDGGLGFNDDGEIKIQETKSFSIPTTWELDGGEF